MWEVQLFIAPAGVVCLLAAASVHEIPTMWRKGDYAIIAEFPLLFFLAAALGLFVQIMTSLVIKHTSSVTLKVLAQLRNALLIFWGVAFYSEIITRQEMVGYSIALVGFCLYSKYKSEQEAEKAKEKSLPK